ncbi:hypothetical protein [Streptomyces leeuwenhoekii]|uniref:hypothetical protein n=1 Tax=Streptomyces leeuwenhoekii TaxID=1437453 RepID=UPI00069ED653|nr:hypothetical protein [Streptomyces leeuwenhoekii]
MDACLLQDLAGDAGFGGLVEFEHSAGQLPGAVVSAANCGSVIRRAWRGARRAVLPPHVFDSPSGRRVYDNRHTRLTKWLNDGIPPAQVAEWAGNSVAVLLATYARCVDGQLPDLKRRLEAAGDLLETPGAG